MLDHWKSGTLKFITHHLSIAKHEVNIATGFFTIQGFNLIRQHLTGKNVRVMVGYDETSRERLREKLIEDVMLHLSYWEETNRREAVLDLVEKLRRKEFQCVRGKRTQGIWGVSDTASCLNNMGSHV
jgi:hypothetical protein